MTQDRNHTFMKALQAMIVTTLMLLTGSNALAQSTGVKVNGSVFGGGNLATVGGSVTVNIKAGTVEQDVYGGGNKGIVSGSTTVNIRETEPTP